MIGEKTMSEEMELLFEELDEEKKPDKRVRKNFLGNIHMESILAILSLFYIMGGKNGISKFMEGSEDTYGHVSKMNHIIRDISPYFGDNTRTTLTGLESVLNVVENIYGIKSGAYKSKAQSMGNIESSKKHIKVLEKIAPHLEGAGKESAYKILELNNRMESLTGRSGNLLKNGQDIIEILDILNVKQAKELKSNITAIKTVVNLLSS